MTTPTTGVGVCEVCGARAFRQFDGHRYCTRTCQDIATSPVRKPIRTAAEIMAQVPANEPDHAASLAKHRPSPNADPKLVAMVNPSVPPGFEVYQRPTAKRSTLPATPKETPVPAASRTKTVQTMDRVEWGDPPPRATNVDRSKVAKAVAELKERPGQWGKVVTDSPSSNAGQQLKVHGCEITTRSRWADDGRKLYSVWARWPEGGQS